MPTHETYITGVKFLKGAQAILDGLNEDDFLALEREPENRFDPFAVKVLNNGHHVGYLPRHIAPLIGKIMVDGRVKTVMRIGGRNRVDITYREKA